MNCEWCEAHVNYYLDGELSESDCAAIEKHFDACAACAEMRVDYSAILNCCLEVRNQPDSPPNPQALWLRISNLIEGEQSALAARDVQLQPAPANGFVTRWLNQNWQLSSQQLASAVLGTIVITALVTVIAVQQSSNAPINAATIFGSPASPAKPSHNNVLDSRLQEQQAAIQYWQNRVEQRKRQWNQHLRDAFDRNLRELDTIVAEQERQLQVNPHDEVSEEMLNSALSDKMELLREFADL
jgi:anti-sigma factor RsiW